MAAYVPETALMTLAGTPAATMPAGIDVHDTACRDNRTFANFDVAQDDRVSGKRRAATDFRMTVAGFGKRAP
jgi:hypothetical protein